MIRCFQRGRLCLHLLARSSRVVPTFIVGISSKVSRGEPASCVGHRFATLRPYGRGMTVTGASPRRDQSLRGHTSGEAEDFPRHYPPAVASSLIEAAGEGFAVMSGSSHGIASVQGNSLTRHGISLP